MTLDHLKKGFWGYKKSSVYEYVTTLEGEFSRKLMERDAQIRDSEALYQERIHQLEEELTTLRQQHEARQTQQHHAQHFDYHFVVHSKSPRRVQRSGAAPAEAQRFQVEGAKSMSMGYISRRPMSMAKVSTIFEP